jgi:hypothetical protein
LLFCINSTFAHQDFYEDLDFSVKCGTFRPLKEKQVEQLQMPISKQCSAISPQGRFRIHYDTTGLDAVDRTDKDGNGIPDYIDSVCAVFDYVYQRQVIEMGYNRPPTDR